MEIIVKKYSDSKKFKPGFNLAMGKVYHTSSDLLSDMKSKGLEPYDKNFTQKPQETYKPSKECHDVVEAIKRGNFQPKSSKQIEEALKKKYSTTKL